MQHRICKTPKLRTPQVFNSPSQWARGADRIPSLQREAGPAAQRGRSPGLDRGHWWLWIPPGAPGGQRSGVCAPWWQLLWHAEEPHRAQALRACRELLGIITWTCSRWARGNWKFDFFFPSDSLLCVCPWVTSAAEKRGGDVTAEGLGSSHELQSKPLLPFFVRICSLQGAWLQRSVCDEQNFLFIYTGEAEVAQYFLFFFCFCVI